MLYGRDTSKLTSKSHSIRMMPQSQSDAFPSHRVAACDTSPPCDVLDGRQDTNGTERVEAKEILNMVANEMNGSIEDATSGAQEETPLLPNSSYINTVLPLTEVQPASPVASQFEHQQSLRSSAWSPETVVPIRSLLLENQGSASVGVDTTGVWPGSPDEAHWEVRDAKSPIEASEEDWSRSDIGESFSDDNGLRFCPVSL